MSVIKIFVEYKCNCGKGIKTRRRWTLKPLKVILLAIRINYNRVAIFSFLQGHFGIFWQIDYEVSVKFSELFNKSEICNDEFYLASQRFLMMNFILKYCKTMIFLGIFCFWVTKKAVFCDFTCFPFCTQFLWFFFVFCITENLPL